MNLSISKLVLVLLGLSFIPSLYADTSDNCTPNGYPINKVIKVEKNLQKSLKDHNIELFAEQFQYPFVVNLSNHKKRIIKTKQELINNFTLIYNQQEINEIITDKEINHPLCRYDGAMIFGGLWLNTDKNNNIKAYVINAQKNSTLPASEPTGIAVEPIKDLKTLERFADLYNHSDTGVKKNIGKRLKVNPKWNDEDKPNIVGDYTAYLLYFVDINNDGKKEWVLFFPCDGSMCTSGIAAVYQVNGQSLHPLSIDQTLTDYLFASTPFITKEKGKILLNFDNSDPAEVCSYLWVGDKVSLVHGSPTICGHE